MDNVDSAPIHAPELSGINKAFLQPSGWNRSVVEQRPVRADGLPLPWFTYGAIEFLHRVVQPTDRVFEYGAGYSTLWWQANAASVVSVEHDNAWVNKLRADLRPNVELTHIDRAETQDINAREVVRQFDKRMRRTRWDNYDPEKIVIRGLDDLGFTAYAAHILDQTEPFDIVVIDGMARRLCTEFAVQCVAADGLIILDNSNRSDYDAAYDILEESGFKQVPFWGLVPGANFLTCTSFFVKDLTRLAAANHRTNSFGLFEY